MIGEPKTPPKRKPVKRSPSESQLATVVDVEDSPHKFGRSSATSGHSFIKVEPQYKSQPLAEKPRKLLRRTQTSFLQDMREALSPAPIVPKSPNYLRPIIKIGSSPTKSPKAQQQLQ